MSYGAALVFTVNRWVQRLGIKIFGTKPIF